MEAILTILVVGGAIGYFLYLASYESTRMEWKQRWGARISVHREGEKFALVYASGNAIFGPARHWGIFPVLLDPPTQNLRELLEMRDDLDFLPVVFHKGTYMYYAELRERYAETINNLTLEEKSWLAKNKVPYQA